MIHLNQMGMDNILKLFGCVGIVHTKNLTLTNLIMKIKENTRKTTSITLDQKTFDEHYQDKIKGKKSSLRFNDMFGVHIYSGCVLMTRRDTKLYFRYEKYEYEDNGYHEVMGKVNSIPNRLSVLGIAKQTSG